MDATKHGAAAGDTGRPDSADWTIDQGWDSYTAEEHGVWQTLFDRQVGMLPGRACEEFMAGLEGLSMATDRIPAFRRLSEVLTARTGWQVVAVPGLAAILVAPNLEAGNMLAKELTFMAHAEAGGLVMGAQVPVILTSRADDDKARLASCAIAALYAHRRR